MAVVECDIVAMGTLQSTQQADPSAPHYITSVNNVSEDTVRCLAGPPVAGDFVLNNPGTVCFIVLESLIIFFPFYKVIMIIVVQYETVS